MAIYRLRIFIKSMSGSHVVHHCANSIAHEIAVSTAAGIDNFNAKDRRMKNISSSSPILALVHCFDIIFKQVFVKPTKLYFVKLFLLAAKNK